MAAARSVHADLWRVFLLTLASLFVIPAATLFFTHYALQTDDSKFLARIETTLAGAPDLTPAQRAEELNFYQTHKLSAACDATGPQDQLYHDKVCSPYSMHWQFHWAERAAFWTLILGVAFLLAAGVLGALAFVNRSLRYASFVAGWRLMSFSSALEVTLQSAMLVWLSFWLTAYFSHSYYIKLVGIAGVVAALAVFFAVYTLFKKLPADNDIEGELLLQADAPRLWERVRQLAARVNTTPPDHIIAGIDNNFFVTEAPCSVAGQALTGRTLFVSIPLLRVLDTAEADAVLAHELAHLGGGDTQSSAALSPKLNQFDQYTWHMRSGGLTIVAYYLLRLYRMIFEFALARDSREREYTADRTAAQLTAPQSIVQSLIKISAYSSYRNTVENQLFEQNRQHTGALGIASFVADGLHPYARSGEFVNDMKTAEVPHPYDSHPHLLERMRNVQHSVGEEDYSAIVTTAPRSTWADEILTAAAIEGRLWTDYEQRFAAAHEQSLAYRYEPANDEEREVVLRYFPPLSFDLGKDRRIDISYQGLHATADAGLPISWDEVKDITFNSSTFGNSLTITHFEKALIRSRTTSIKLKGLAKQENAFRTALGQYWQRHQVMRAQQAAQTETLATA